MRYMELTRFYLLEQNNQCLYTPSAGDSCLGHVKCIALSHPLLPTIH